MAYHDTCWVNFDLERTRDVPQLNEPGSIGYKNSSDFHWHITNITCFNIKHFVHKQTYRTLSSLYIRSVVISIDQGWLRSSYCHVGHQDIQPCFTRVSSSPQVGDLSYCRLTSADLDLYQTASWMTFWWLHTLVCLVLLLINTKHQSFMWRISTNLTTWI